MTPTSVLSDGTIRRLVEAGQIKIEPWDPGMIQPASVDLRLGTDQLLDLAADQVLLVWPELHLPRPVAFGQRADQQRLQLGPGFLRV